MTRIIIDTGTEGNSATGDTLRTAMTKINTNFEDVYTVVGDPSTGLLTNSTTNGDIKVQPNGTGIVEIDQLQITDSAITPLITNGDLTLTANGTGDIVLGDVTVSDNKVSTNASNANLQLDAAGNGAIEIIPIIIKMANLPTSDPSSAGQLWNDSNTLKVSAG
jgi:hypothetical protein